MLVKDSNFGYHDTYYQKRILWTIESSGKYDTHDYIAWCNLPTVLQIAQLDMDSAPMNFILVRVHDPEDTDTIDQLAASLQEATGLTVEKTYAARESTA